LSENLLTKIQNFRLKSLSSGTNIDDFVPPKYGFLVNF